jgi:hypothetical protein
MAPSVIRSNSLNTAVVYPYIPDMPVKGRRLLVVEDEALMASLLSDVLTSTGFEVRTSGNVSDARSAIEDFDPDVVLLDISLGAGPSGIDLAHVLDAQRPDIALIFLTKHPDRRTAGLDVAAVPSRAGFLRKDMISDTNYLLESIESVLADRARDVRHDLLQDRPLVNLTKSQLEVLRMASQGLTNAAIAKRRNSTERAVEMLLQAVFAQLQIDASGDINPRIEAVRRYIEAAGLPERP